MTDGIVMSIWSSISDALYWTPDWVPGIVVLAIAVIAALVAHRIVFRLLTRFGERNPFVRRVVTRVKGPCALALVAFALGAALQSAPFDPAVSASFGRLLLIAFIVLAGWIAHIAAETGGSLYLRRFTVESVDDLLARKHVTQVRILKRAVNTLIVVVTLSAVLMTFEPVRQYGVSLFASAGVAGLVVGLAARPMLSNLIAGIQIATTQPIRIDDQVIVENESGRIEEITSTYVVIRLWDLRRLIVPLSHFIEKPFQNWTRETTNLIGSVFLYVDFTAPVEVIRANLLEIVQASKLWDGEVAKLQVTDAKESGIELRALASARTAGDAFDLRCEIREQLIGFLQKEYPSALPRARQETMRPDRPDRAAQQDNPDQRAAQTAAR